MDVTLAWVYCVLGLAGIIGLTIFLCVRAHMHREETAIKAGLVKKCVDTGRKDGNRNPIYETIWVKPEDANKPMGTV